MKRLILDHFRRWWWVLALGAVYALVLGWAVALPADYGEHWHGKHLFWLVWLKVQGRMFVMQTFVLATFTGAILLAFDLKRGLVRTVRALPLTTRQIGRGWWLAAAGIPAIASVLLLFLGAGTFHLSHPGNPFPVGRLALASVFTVLWFGTGFTIYLNKSTATGWGGNWRTVIVNLVVTALVIWMIFGFALSLDATKNPVKCAAFVLAGVIMTAIGWSHVERFNPGRVGQPGWGLAKRFMPGRAGSGLTPLASADTRDLVPAPRGPGAIPFLMRTIVARIFFRVIVMVLFGGLMFRLEGIIKSWDDAVRFMGLMAAAFWLIIFFQITPFLRHLRFLRTLPISAGRLAVVLMAMGMLPLLALGALVAAAAWLITGPAAAITVLGSYTLTLASAALCICFAVWRGGGLLSSAFLLFSLIGAFALSGRDVPVPLSGLIVVVCVLSGYLLTRCALNRSRHAYLSRSAPANPWGAVAWDPGR